MEQSSVRDGAKARAGIIMVQCDGTGCIKIGEKTINLPDKAKSIKVRGEKIFVDGKEYVDGKWKITVPSILSIFF